MQVVRLTIKKKTWTEENVSLTNLDALYTATEKYVTRNWETDSHLNF